ncbi:aminoglycoside phosphotransferase family protein [Streptomyces niveus]|uniref:phosphotransferase n=1 Tax=Streptomyces niveus TaxID=193462 RepID=UPI002E309210|nr:phosphotransferase [Streptomyces niveus]
MATGTSRRRGRHRARAVATRILRGVRDFQPSAQAVWCDPDARWRPGQIMPHGDLTSWNSVWVDDRLVGVIDWDLAIPGEALDDLAQLAWYSVPLRLPDRQR